MAKYLGKDKASRHIDLNHVNGRDTSTTAPSDLADDVRAFYERLPYPAPLTNLDRHRELYRNPERRRALFHLLWPMEPLRNDLQILIAGCGTSQAATYALREPDACVTAIDISETSLSYTRDLKDKYNLRNLDLHRLSIEDAAQLDRTFDLIVCTGVLHHLPNPDRGLRALRDVLAPQGAMHLMVYATYGRAGIYMMQEYCRLLEISPTDEELSDLAAAIGGLPPDHPISDVVSRAKDFRQPAALADALLHPQDRSYTVPQLYAWLERCGMSFGRWHEQAPYLPQCGAMAATSHAARLAQLPPRSQHAAVELFRGTMDKHNFIAFRNDYHPNQAINFGGKVWPDYVPLRLPWTRDIRERVPPGSTAVLINQAHTCRDLILPVNEAEDQLLTAIDGKRSIREISHVASQQTDEEHTRQFFEQLWRYDQVVFDATRR